MIIYGCLHLVNYDFFIVTSFKTTTVVQNKRSFSLNDGEGNVIRVKSGQAAVDQPTTS